MEQASTATVDRDGLQAVKVRFNAMACGCEIVASLADPRAAQAAIDAAIAEVRRIEHKYSRYREDSVVGAINHAAGKPALDCDAETNALLDLAQAFYDDSEGLFDITAGVLRRAWDFRTGRIPTPAQLQALTARIGWQRVRRDGESIMLPADMEIDFGGFGKEYAVDRAAMVLEAHGVAHGYVNLGGDARAVGPKPDGQPWVFGIQDPRDPRRIVATIPLARGGLATSGDYERYFEHDGQRYCHILDPRSGWPVTYWRSISVLAPTALMAGKHSTIGMLLQQRATAYLHGSGAACLMIDHQGALTMREATPASREHGKTAGSTGQH